MNYDIKPGAVIHGDCLTVLRQMEPDSVDMIITDPPYGVDYQSNRPKSKDPSAKFEKIANDKTPFIWWIYDAFRVLKDGGGVLCFSRWDVQQVFMDALKLAGFTVKSVLVWDREVHGMGDLKGNFAPRYDTCIFATKGRYLLPGKRPADVIRCQRLNGADLVHPNEKPVDLLRQLVESTTAPGALILDPFAGSGSTLAAAALAGRQYIGIELSEEYHAIAQQRAIDAVKTRLLKGA
ncbi:MAG: DNA methyltransferase [Pseudoflavonifractor sp.]